MRAGKVSASRPEGFTYPVKTPTIPPPPAWPPSPSPSTPDTQARPGNPPTAGNGVLVAMACESPAKVDKAYRRAMELGAKDEGPAGPRGDTFYAGYFRDPDGNKLNAFCMTKA